MRSSAAPEMEMVVAAVNKKSSFWWLPWCSDAGRAVAASTTMARPASLHHGSHQKLLFLFTAATTISISGAAELRIKAQLFATHREQSLPAPDLVSARANDAARRYADASELGALLLGDAFVPVAVHPSFHTFERGVVDDVTLTELAQEVKAAFVEMLEAFQSTMLGHCDELAAAALGESEGEGGGGGEAASKGVAEMPLIDFDE